MPGLVLQRSKTVENWGNCCVDEKRCWQEDLCVLIVLLLPWLRETDNSQGLGLDKATENVGTNHFTLTTVMVTAAFLGHNISMNYVAHICCLETLTTSGAKHVLMKLFPLEKFSPYLVQIISQSLCICQRFFSQSFCIGQWIFSQKIWKWYLLSSSGPIVYEKSKLGLR